MKKRLHFMIFHVHLKKNYTITINHKLENI